MCLGMSFIFLFTVIGYRIAYRDGVIPADLRVTLFKIDVVQHQVWAAVSSDAKDMEIAEQLLKLGFFSRIYSDAGWEMLNEKADSGYRPAQMRVAQIYAQYPMLEPVQDP